MGREHSESLKQQLIEAMASRFDIALAKSVFECDLWPVLDAAMTAGELLVARNTVPQQPVHEAITAWLQVAIWTAQRARFEEATISKNQLLKILHNLEISCEKALAEAKMVAK